VYVVPPQCDKSVQVSLDNMLLDIFKALRLYSLQVLPETFTNTRTVLPVNWEWALPAIHWMDK
jgi:hypothetical protein